MQQHGRKYFTGRPLLPPDPEVGVKMSKFHFFRTWSCCKSNSRNQECSNIVANILQQNLKEGIIGNILVKVLCIWTSGLILSHLKIFLFELWRSFCSAQKFEVEGIIRKNCVKLF